MNSQDSDSDSELDKWIERDSEPMISRSIFKVAIQNSMFSLAYLTLSEYDCTKALEDVIQSR